MASFPNFILHICKSKSGTSGAPRLSLKFCYVWITAVQQLQLISPTSYFPRNFGPNISNSSVSFDLHTASIKLSASTQQLTLERNFPDQAVLKPPSFGNLEPQQLFKSCSADILWWALLLKCKGGCRYTSTLGGWGGSTWGLLKLEEGLIWWQKLHCS